VHAGRGVTRTVVSTMNTRRPSPLNTLLEYEERERDAARMRMHDAHVQAEHARAQADDLERYRHDYGQRWSRQFRQSGTAEIVQCYQSFMQRLDHAVVQQAAVATHARQRADATVEVLRAHEQRVAAVRKLIERQQQALARAGQRAEQRRDDEFAQRSHARLAAQREAMAAGIAADGSGDEGHGVAVPGPAADALVRAAMTFPHRDPDERTTPT
jgi:flagellar FliJ protein